MYFRDAYRAYSPITLPAWEILFLLGVIWLTSLYVSPTQSQMMKDVYLLLYTLTFAKVTCGKGGAEESKDFIQYTQPYLPSFYQIVDFVTVTIDLATHTLFV